MLRPYVKTWKHESKNANIKMKNLLPVWRSPTMYVAHGASQEVLSLINAPNSADQSHLSPQPDPHSEAKGLRPPGKGTGPLS